MQRINIFFSHISNTCLRLTFCEGGSVKGGQILGEYPESITDEGPLTLSRGKLTFLLLVDRCKDDRSRSQFVLLTLYRSYDPYDTMGSTFSWHRLLAWYQ